METHFGFELQRLRLYQGQTPNSRESDKACVALEARHLYSSIYRHPNTQKHVRYHMSHCVYYWHDITHIISFSHEDTSPHGALRRVRGPKLRQSLSCQGPQRRFPGQEVNQQLRSESSGLLRERYPLSIGSHQVCCRMIFFGRQSSPKLEASKDAEFQRTAILRLSPTIFRNLPSFQPESLQTAFCVSAARDSKLSMVAKLGWQMRAHVIGASRG